MATRTPSKSLADNNAHSEPVLKDWREADSRTERGRLIRESLLKSAAEIVGDVGYQNASVSLITQRAGVAQGTFYNHFESRQDIFDQILPTIGIQMLDYVKECAKAGESVFEKEELSFIAFFSFQQKNPHFFRILNEAENFAPKAYRSHLELVSKGYINFLRHASEQGDIQEYDPQEFEVIAFILMAARSYLAWRFAHGAEQQNNIPEWVTKAYMKFVRQGLASIDH